MERSEVIERDGFQIRRLKFFPPSDTTRLDSISKREITICNLFANHRLPIRDIVRVLDEEYGRVVQVLINRGIVYERRGTRQVISAPIDRRHSFFKTL